MLGYFLRQAEKNYQIQSDRGEFEKNFELRQVLLECACVICKSEWECVYVSDWVYVCVCVYVCGCVCMGVCECEYVYVSASACTSVSECVRVCQDKCVWFFLEKECVCLHAWERVWGNKCDLKSVF